MLNAALTSPVAAMAKHHIGIYPYVLLIIRHTYLWRRWQWLFGHLASYLFYFFPVLQHQPSDQQLSKGAKMTN